MKRKILKINKSKKKKTTKKLYQLFMFVFFKKTFKKKTENQ